MKHLICCILLLTFGLAGISGNLHSAYGQSRKAKAKQQKHRKQPTFRRTSFPTPEEFVKNSPKWWTVADTKAIINARATELPHPVYPVAAIKACADGLVKVEVIVDETGRVIAAKATSGHLLLRGTAVVAARRAKFPPMFINSAGRILAKGTIVYKFTLPK